MKVKPEKNRQHSIERYNVTFFFHYGKKTKKLNKNNGNENEKKKLHHHNAFKVFIALT